MAGGASAQDRLPVVASFSILADMVKNVGGDHVEITTLVGPEVDAHVWAPGPLEADAVSKAKLVVFSGMDFEPWGASLIEQAGYTGPVVTVTEGVVPHVMPPGWGGHSHSHGGEEHADEDEHAEGEMHTAGAEHAEGEMHAEGEGHGHTHEGGDIDPHVWNDLRNGVIFVEHIAAALQAADPANAATYAANAAAYEAKLVALDAQIRARIGDLPFDERRVLMSHDDMGYFGEAYGVEMVPPGDPAAMIDTIKKEWVSAVFVEDLTDPALIEKISAETGAVVGGPLWTDTLSQPDGPAGTYIDMQTYNADQITSALEKASAE
jgi:zinc/manganese transport system substrate-binding protein